MAISNTSILIKRSGSTATPSTLKAGELAFSYASNNIFIGTADGAGAVAIGGKSTYDTVNAATSSNTASTLIKRDVNGAFSGRLLGTADKAQQLETSRDFSISGGDITATTQGFDGTGAVVLNAALNDVPGLVAGTVGSTTSVPIITYGANGRILSITSEAIATSLGIAGDTGTDSIPGGETLTFTGGAGITSAVTDNTVTFDVDDTVVRANTDLDSQTINSSVSITKDLSVTGNLTVLGTTTTLETSQLSVEDSLIALAVGNNTSDALDIGFVGQYNDGGVASSGLIRSAADKDFYLFQGYTPAISANSSVNVNDASFEIGTLHTNVVADTVVASGINVIDRIEAAFTAANNSVQKTSALSSGAMIVADGTDNIKTVANAEFIATGTAGSGKAVTSLTIDAYGRVTAATFGAVSGDITGLTVEQGGTGATSFSAGRILVGNGTGALQSLANATYTATGSGATNNTLSSLTVDDYGRVTAATFQAISGLTVTQGGTGLSTATTNGITYGNGTSALGVTAAAGDADQSYSNQFLTVTAAGVPVWSNTMDGGTF